MNIDQPRPSALAPSAWRNQLDGYCALPKHIVDFLVTRATAH